MKIQPLYDLQQEINRLFIAGSKFAKNDPHLLKLVPVFNKLAEKAPVFKKLVNDIEQLTQTDSQESAAKLIALSTLLYSVLYTQGDMLVADQAQTEQLPHIDLNDVVTTYSYQELRPVIKALSESNQGRLDVLTEARKRGVFQDFRTYSYLNQAVDDKYSELADYVETLIREDLNASIVPFLVQGFSYEGQRGDARRLLLLNHFNYTGIDKMVEQVMQGSSALLQTAAIQILEQDMANEDLIIQLTTDKNKLVREAAYIGLAKLNTEKSLTKLTTLYLTNKNKTNAPSIIKALQYTSLPFGFDDIFSRIRQYLADFLATQTDEESNALTALEALSENLIPLYKKDRPEVFEFISEILTNSQYNELIKQKSVLLARTAEHISERIIWLLESFDQQKRLPFYELIDKKMPDVAWKEPFYEKYFACALAAGYSKEQIYDTFVNAYRRQFISIDMLCLAHRNDDQQYDVFSNESIDKLVKAFDPRWFDVFLNVITHNKRSRYDAKTVLRLLDHYHPTPSPLFEQLLALPHILKLDEINVWHMLMRREIPGRFEAIYSIIKNNSWISQSTLQEYKQVNFWHQFPKEYAIKFKILAKKAEALNKSAEHETYLFIIERINNQ